MSSQFQQPGVANPDDKIVWAESLGALLLIFPTSFQGGVKTTHGEADAVYARIVRLEDGRVYENAMIYPQALVTQTKAAVPDGMVLGRLAQGENKKGNPPWLLQPHTEADVAQAEAWLAANPRNQFQNPAPPVPPTVPAWNAPATPAAPQWGGQAPAPAAPAPGGWGQQAPAPQAPGGWNAPAPAAPSAPAWGGAPEGADGQAPAAWQNAGAPTPPAIDPQLVAYLTAKGFPPPPGTTQAAAEQMAATLG